MSDKSHIEWTDATWNPATGCTKISPGCAHCYIERTPPFRVNHRRFDAKGHIPIHLHPERLTQPLHWKRPRRVFVNSLSDLFHEDIPTEFIDRIFAVMALTPQHTYQILTKRPERMREYFYRSETRVMVIGNAILIGMDFRECEDRDINSIAWPLPNVWLGVTAENQHFADERIPLLLQTPAAVRFVSYEPALGPINLHELPIPAEIDPRGFLFSALTECDDEHFYNRHAKLNWVICGGESGPGARPMHPQWARSVRDQCVGAGVPFFMKQICERGRKVPFEKWLKDLQVREYPGETEVEKL